VTAQYAQMWLTVNCCQWLTWFSSKTGLNTQSTLAQWTQPQSMLTASSSLLLRSNMIRSYSDQLYAKPIAVIIRNAYTNRYITKGDKPRHYLPTLIDLCKQFIYLLHFSTLQSNMINVIRKFKYPANTSTQVICTNNNAFYRQTNYI